MNVTPLLSGSAPITAPQLFTATDSPSSEEPSFATLLSSAVGEVAAQQQTAHASAESFMRGETTELHKVALDQQRASILFDLFLQVRNKVISAYQEIMRSQI